MDKRKRHILIILDGYGIAEDPSVSAIDHAQKPFLDALFAKYPHARLRASEQAVGLPEGQMGNSEVGHMNLGAGRMVPQELMRINLAVEQGDLFEIDALVQAARYARANESKLHLMGLFSDGGVHSHNDHLFALLELARRQGLSNEQVCVHVFTDGHDTDPQGADPPAGDRRTTASAHSDASCDSNAEANACPASAADGAEDRGSDAKTDFAAAIHSHADANACAHRIIRAYEDR